MVISASASFTLNEISIAFDAKIPASQRTSGIDNRTITPKVKLIDTSVMLSIRRRNTLAVAKGAIAKASLTCDASLDALAINSPVGTLS